MRITGAIISVNGKLNTLLITDHSVCWVFLELHAEAKGTPLNTPISAHGTLQYDEVIKDQLSHGIVEKATEKADRRKLYLWHKLVVCESAESTKLCIVYDASG